ncbi:hypothetical protein P9112_012281 [Eukaryota sp. TZLM1-RC]
MNHLSPGERVAALVPYFKNETAWLVCTVVAYDQHSGTCTVRDEIPESRKLSQWTVPASRCVKFPPSQEELVSRSFTPGEKVLSLWYINEIRDWSSLFYNATVHTVQGNGQTLQLAFEGDNCVTPVPLDKVLQFPKTETLQQQEQHENQTTVTAEHQKPVETESPATESSTSAQHTAPSTEPPMKMSRTEEASSESAPLQKSEEPAVEQKIETTDLKDNQETPTSSEGKSAPISEEKEVPTEQRESEEQTVSSA